MSAPFDPTKLGQATALVSLVGFAIQQALQACDTFVSAWIDWLKAKPSPNDSQAGNLSAGTLRRGLTDADFKKSVMVALSFVLGLGAVWAAYPRLCLLRYLAEIPDQGTMILDVVVSALVFSAGTEGANTVLKYFGYVKDARKKTVIELDVVPKTAAIAKSATQQFVATAKNGEDPSVTWKVLTGGGGTISPDGLYTAPNAGGTFQIAALSASDPSAVALATITVT